MFGNFAKETSATTGTGTLTLSSVSGFPRFSNVFQDGQYCSYAILNSSGEPLEAGIGRYVASNTLVRTKPTATYSGGTYDNTTPSALSLSGTNTIIATPVAGTFGAAGTGIDTGVTANDRLIWSPTQQLVAGTTKGIGSDEVFFVPFLNMFGTEVDGVAFNVTTAAASQNARVGIYQTQPSGVIGDILVQSADVSIGTTGVKVGTFTTRFMPPGYYFLAIAAKGGSAGVFAANAGSTSAVTFPHQWGRASFENIVIYATHTLSGGWTNLPTTPSALSNVNATSDFPPALMLRAA